MNEQGEPVGPVDPEERDGGGSGGDGFGDAGRSADAAPGEVGDDAAGDAGERRLHRQIRIAISILGPVLLTTAYFTLPFDVLGPHHEVLAWVVIVGLLTLLAIGMVVTTNRTLLDQSGRFSHPGVAILLMSWTAILVFAACYWAMATRHNQFVGLQTRLDSLYFTGVTMSTVGYGDIHPSGQLARAVVLVQLVYTFVFLVGGITAIRTHARARLARRISTDVDADVNAGAGGRG